LVVARAVAAALAASCPEADVRVHAPFSDEELWDRPEGLDHSVLPYRFGTRSGWLACHDLGTAVLAPTRPPRSRDSPVGRPQSSICRPVVAWSRPRARCARDAHGGTCARRPHHARGGKGSSRWPPAPLSGPRGPFWRSQSRDQFLAFSFAGQALVTPGDGAGSGLVKALRGQLPFGKHTGTPGAGFRRMPAGRPAVPDEQIAVISTWIDDGAPDADEPVGGLVLDLDGAPSGAAFLIVADAGRPPIPRILRLRTTDGSQGTVAVGSPSASLQFSTDSVEVSAAPVELSVVASAPSAAANDLTIEVSQDGQVLTTFELTAIAKPAVRFRGTFQCRLATDPDAFDDPWGQGSSFGMYAVPGPDPDHPDEPPLDRIVRFSGAVAARPFCPPIGVRVTAIEAHLGDTTVQLDIGDPLLGQPVQLGPACVFEGRNRQFAPDGFEPIANFVAPPASEQAKAHAAPATSGRPSGSSPGLLGNGVEDLGQAEHSVQPAMSSALTVVRGRIGSCATSAP
jgi:hypothetical protein